MAILSQFQPGKDPFRQAGFTQETTAAAGAEFQKTAKGFQKTALLAMRPVGKGQGEVFIDDGGVPPRVMSVAEFLHALPNGVELSA